MGSGQSIPKISEIAPIAAAGDVPDILPDVLPEIPPDHQSSDFTNVVKNSDEGAEVTGPPTYEHLHMRTKEIFPSCFDGARFVIQKTISEHFQTSHSFSFNNKEPGYRFGATYIGVNKTPNDDVYPVILAQLSPNGHLQGHVIHQLTANWRLRYVTQMTLEKQHQEISQEWRFGRWLTSFTLANPSVDLSRFIAVTGISAQLNKRFSIVNQFLLQRSPMVPGNMAGSWSVGMRLLSESSVPLPEGPSSAGANFHRVKEQKKWQFSVGASPLSGSIEASLAVRVNEQLQIASHIDIQTRQGEAVASVGYQYDIPAAHATFKTQIKSNLEVESTVERRLLPLPFLFSLSARADPWSSKYSYGMGLSSE